MSNYIYGKMIVTGKSEILREFVKYLEDDYSDEYVREGIKSGGTRDGWINRGYSNENCYWVEGDDNYFYIEIDKLSRVFPTLKFEYISKSFDCITYSKYQIILNGKRVNYNEGNYLTFNDEDVEERCKLCNCELDYSPNEGNCFNCEEFRASLYGDFSDDLILKVFFWKEKW